MFAKLIKFLKEVKIEVSKVSYPSRKELWTSTGVVIVFSAILSLFIYAFDLLFSKALIAVLR